MEKNHLDCLVDLTIFSLLWLIIILWRSNNIPCCCVNDWQSLFNEQKRPFPSFFCQKAASEQKLDKRLVLHFLSFLFWGDLERENVKQKLVKKCSCFSNTNLEQFTKIFKALWQCFVGYKSKLMIVTFVEIFLRRGKSKLSLFYS